MKEIKSNRCDFIIRIILIFVYQLSINIGHSQNITKEENFSLITQSSLNNIKKVDSLNELAWQYMRVDSNKASEYAILAKRISDSLLYIDGQITSIRRLGQIAFSKKNYDEAERINLELLDFEKKSGNTKEIAKTQSLLGEIYNKKENHIKSLAFSIESFENFKTHENFKQAASIANSIGVKYRTLGKFKKSIDYHLKSLEIRVKLNDSLEIASSYMTLGNYYTTLENYDKAAKYLKAAEFIYLKFNNINGLSIVYDNFGCNYLKTENIDLAIFYLEKSLLLKKQLKIEEKNLSIYNNLGAAYYKQERLEKALKYYKKSIRLTHGNVEKTMNFAEATSNIGHIYYKKKEYKKAVEYYLASLKELDRMDKPVPKLVTLKFLSKSFEKQNKYKEALKYSNQYQNVNDSLQKSYKTAVNFEDKYEAEKTEKLILEKNNEITEARLKNTLIKNEQQNQLIIGLFITLILLVLLFFVAYRVKSGKEKIKNLKKDKELKDQKITEILKNQELKSMSAMIQGEEKERQRIAQDLHDRLGSILSMVKIHFKSVEDYIKHLKTPHLEQYQKANQLLDNACNEVRAISHQMSSGVLSKFGLVAALEDLKETLISSNQIDVEFISHGLDSRLQNIIEIEVYRIVQELISNILKHSYAKEVTIQLIYNEENLNITVEDNGIGFNVEKNENKGIGLKNVEARIYKMSGELLIDSSINNGTTITINIPIKTNNYD